MEGGHWAPSRLVAFLLGPQCTLRTGNYRAGPLARPTAVSWLILVSPAGRKSQASEPHQQPKQDKDADGPPTSSSVLSCSELIAHNEQIIIIVDNYAKPLT